MEDLQVEEEDEEDEGWGEIGMELHSEGRVFILFAAAPFKEGGADLVRGGCNRGKRFLRVFQED